MARTRASMRPTGRRGAAGQQILVFLKRHVERRPVKDGQLQIGESARAPARQIACMSTSFSTTRYVRISNCDSGAREWRGAGLGEAHDAARLQDAPNSRMTSSGLARDETRGS